MRMLVISGNYPSPAHPTRGTFVYNLVQDFVRQGATVTTISPQTIWTKGWSKGSSNSQSYGPEASTVFRPRYMSFSNKTLYPGFSTAHLSAIAFTAAVGRAVRGVAEPDIVYSHFLYPSGFAASRVAEKFGVPSVVALGESTMLRHERPFGVHAIRRELHRFDHIITVSKVLRDYCVARMGVDATRITVTPNAVNTDLFYPRERWAMRRKLGLPRDAFIAAYVGHFDERKGYARVMAALAHNPSVRAIFIGNGPRYPSGKQVLFAGPVHHGEVPEWLAASDIFVLPTLAEGDPNAVKEALAVGLPVVISDIPELREQFDERFALFVAPRDTEAIAAAIERLNKDVGCRMKMAEEAVSFAQGKSLSRRAGKILDLLRGLVQQQVGTKGTLC